MYPNVSECVKTSLNKPENVEKLEGNGQKLGEAPLGIAVLQIRSVIRVITLITLLCCFDEEGHSLYSKKDILSVRRRTLLVFEEGQPLCSTSEILYVRGRTFCVFEAEHSVCSKQEVPCVRNRTFLVIEAGHSLCSRQDIPCVRSRTFLVFQAGHLLRSKQDIMCGPSRRKCFSSKNRFSSKHIDPTP